MEREQPHAQVVAGLWGRLKSVHIWQQGVAEAVRGLTCGSLVLSCLCLADTRFISLPHDVCISLKSEYLVFLYFGPTTSPFRCTWMKSLHIQQLSRSRQKLGNTNQLHTYWHRCHAGPRLETCLPIKPKEHITAQSGLILGRSNGATYGSLTCAFPLSFLLLSFLFLS